MYASMHVLHTVNGCEAGNGRSNEFLPFTMCMQQLYKHEACPWPPGTADWLAARTTAAVSYICMPLLMIAECWR
jgi:hypothetical protein